MKQTLEQRRQWKNQLITGRFNGSKTNQSNPKRGGKIASYSVKVPPTTIPNTMNTTNAPYGYIVTATRGLIADGYTPLGVVGEGGSYEYAAADTDTGINLAVYPSPETASAAMVRAARGRDPLVWDGLTIRTLGRAWHESHTVSECVAFGCVTYPDGEPAEKLRAV